MLMLDAYVDESGTHNTSAVVAVAAYLSTSDRWLKFKVDWKAALAEKRLDIFHMNKFSNRAKPFDSWSDSERTSLLNRLIEIINANIIMSAGILIPRSRFNSLLSSRVRAHYGIYGVAIDFLIMDIARGLEPTEKDVWITYILEDGAVGKGEITGVIDPILSDLKQCRELRLKALRFESKRHLLPLQAADVLVYELYKHYNRTGGRANMRYPLKELEKRPQRWSLLDEDSLRNLNDVLTIKINELESKKAIDV
jgi:hypothetical protein